MLPTKILEQMNKIKKSIAVVAALLLMSSSFAITAYGNDCQIWAEDAAIFQTIH
jgi:hypothetical protein